MSNQLQIALCGAYFAACGFQTAEKTNIPTLLHKINPDGGTAMRDSLIQGSKLMLKLNQVLKELEVDSNYNFVHVILTDGADCNSKNSLQDAAKMMLLIGKLIHVKALKIIFIGVGVEEQAERELKLLAQVAGQNAQYYNVNSSDIGSIFNKIEIGLRVERNIQMGLFNGDQGSGIILSKQQRPYLQINVKNFAVMFNLDVSGSMSGSKWTNVCKSVSAFISKLGGSDLVSGLVFNNQVKMLSSIKEDDKLFARPRSSSNAKQTTTMSSTKVQFNVTQIGNQEECNIM